MLEMMRSRAAKWVIQILAFFLIISFGIWGIGDIFRGRTGPNDVAEVGGMPISGQELNIEFRRTVEALRSRLGPSFDSEQARQLGLLEQTLRSLIAQRLFALEAERLGLDAGDALIRRTIASDSGFQNRSGAFDPELFRQALQRRNMSEAGFVATLRAEIVRSQITGALTAGGAVPKALHDVIYAYRNERRVAEVVRVTHVEMSQIADPTDAEITAFHSKNPELFTAPQFRDLTVVYFDPAAMAAEIRPAEERLREEYQARLPSLSVPERRELQQILVRDEALAGRVHEALKQGRDFTKAASELAKVAPSSLDLGRLRRVELPKDLADVAFGLPEGGFSAPVKSPLGWHVLRVVKIYPGKTPSFEEVRKTISDELAREQAVDALIGVANQFEDALAGGASLEDAASRASARVLNVPALDARGNDADGKAVAGIPSGAKFLETVFATEAGASSVLTETRDGGFFMVRVNRVIEPALRPLADVRDKVIEAWKRSRMDSEAKTRAEALAAVARDKGSLAEAAREKGFEIETTKPFSRFIQDPELVLPSSLVDTLFEAKVGTVALGPFDHGHVVARLTSISRPEPGDNAEEYKTIGESLKADLSDDLVGQYTDALRHRYTVTIDSAAVQALF